MKPARSAAAGILVLVFVIVGALILAALFGFAPLDMLVRRAGAAEPAPLAKSEIVRKAVDEAIRPGYRALSTAADTMAAAGGALCKAPSAEALLAARQGFAGLVTGFSRIEFVRFGPIMEENRLERVLFWPDRRGVALRQVQAILGTKDEAATAAASLHEKSVAVQGLNALEFLLFGTGAEALASPDGAFRCRYAAAVAANLAGIARETSAGWDAKNGIADALTVPRPTSPAYREIDDSLDEILNTLVHGLESIRDLRIKPGLGDTIEDARPNAWLYGRSELTEASLQADFAGLAELFDRSGIAALLPPSERGMEASIQAEFGKAGRAFQTIAMPLAKAAGDPARRERVGDLMAVTQSLQALFADRFAPAVGLTAGFSSLDGD